MSIVCLRRNRVGMTYVEEGLNACGVLSGLSGTALAPFLQKQTRLLALTIL